MRAIVVQQVGGKGLVRSLDPVIVTSMVFEAHQFGSMAEAREFAAGMKGGLRWYARWVEVDGPQRFYGANTTHWA